MCGSYWTRGIERRFAELVRCENASDAREVVERATSYVLKIDEPYLSEDPDGTMLLLRRGGSKSVFELPPSKFFRVVFEQTKFFVHVAADCESSAIASIEALDLDLAVGPVRCESCALM